MESNPVRIEELLAHAGWVRRLAARLVRDAGTADDVAQEVWAYALRSPPHERTNLRAWLSAAVRNAVRSLRRSQARRTERESAVAAREHAPAAAELVERAHLHRDLVEQVLALDEPFRSLVLAHWFEEQSLAESARRLGLTERVAKARLDEAHAILRRRMDKAAGGREVWSLAFLKWTEPQLATGAAAGAGTALTLGGIVVANKLVVGSLVLVLATGLGWFLWPHGEPPPTVSGGIETPETHPESAKMERSELAPDSAGAQREALKAESPKAAAAPAVSEPRWIVRGHVRGAPGGRETETRLTARFIGRWDIQDHASGWASKDGRFELDLTEARKPWLRAGDPTDVVVVAENPVCLLADARAEYTSAVFDKSPAASAYATFTCDLTLTPGAVATGRVSVPSDWKPPGGPERERRPCVGLFDLLGSASRTEKGLDHATCDAQGHWSLRANRGGKLTVIACAEGLRPTTLVVDLVLGESTDVGAIELESGMSISGRVLRAGESVGSGVSVVAELKSDFRERLEISVPYSGRFMLDPLAGRYEHESVSTRTLADGSFRLAGLAPTEYELRVDSVPNLRMGLGGRERGERTVRAPQADVVLEGVPPTIELAVTVNAEPPKDAALEGVVVDLIPMSRESSDGAIDLTGAAKGYGKIQLIAGVAYELRVRPGRYLPTIVSIGALEPGEQRTFALDLKPQDQASTLVVRFAADPPESLATAQFAFLDASITDDEQAQWQEVKRSEQGTFVLRDRQPGNYRVLVRPYDSWDNSSKTYYVACTFPLTLASKSTVELELKLTTGALVRMSAKDERGGFVRAPVELRNAAGEKLATHFYCITAGGRYGCDWYLCEQGPNDHPPLPAGHYEFTLKAEGFAPEVVPVDLIAGETKTLDVVLHPK